MKTAAQKRDRAILNARVILGSPDDYAIADTETTGVDNIAQVISFAAVDPLGNELLNTFCIPGRAIPEEAIAIHGLSLDRLKELGAGSWEDSAVMAGEALVDRTVIFYNAPFDKRLIENTSEYWGVGNPIKKNPLICLQSLRKDFLGKKKQLGGDHTALGDCRACLDILKEIASAKLSVWIGQDKPAIADIVGRLDAIAAQQKALKKEENDLKAIAWQAVEDNNGPVTLPDGRSLQHGSNIVKLKPIAPVEDLPDAFRVLSVNKKAATEAIEKQPGVLNALFSWESSSFLKIVKAEKK